MPYVRCPGCGLDTYSAAGHSTVDECPRCGGPLGDGLRWARLHGVLLRRRLPPTADREARSPTPPSAP